MHVARRGAGASASLLTGGRHRPSALSLLPVRTSSSRTIPRLSVDAHADARADCLCLARYAVPAHAAQDFEDCFKAVMPEMFAAQPDLLMQLVTMLNPRVLQVGGPALRHLAATHPTCRARLTQHDEQLASRG